MNDGLKKILCFLALLVCLCLPAAALLQEYLGLIGVAVYFAAAAAVLLIVFRFRHALRDWIGKGYPVFAGLFALGLLAVFAVVYPLETAGKFSKGSDRDETLNLSVQALFAGRYPYYETTPLGNPISVLPGAVFLAAPFAALGNSAYQNFFWMILFLAATGAYLKDRTSAFLAVAAAVVLSPAVQYEYISGGDVLANSIYVLIFLFLAVRAFSRPGSSVWVRLACGIALGVGLASRSNFFLLLPLLFAVLLKNAGWKAAVFGVLTASGAAGAAILPFYLRDPASFYPFTAANKLVLYDELFPRASTMIILAAAGLSVALSVWLGKSPRERSLPMFFGMCAAVQLLPLFCGVVLDSLHYGAVDFRILHDRYGLMFLFFGLWGSWNFLFAAEGGEPSVRPVRKPAEPLRMEHI
jgi:hypothetical protein